MKEEQKKICMLFDGEVLLNGLNNDSGRSGVFYMSYRLLHEFSKKSDLEISVLISNCSKCEIQLIRDKNIIPSNCKILETCLVPSILYKIRTSYKKNRDNILKKAARFLLYRYYRLTKIISILFLLFKLNKQSYDIYFSPQNEILRHIRIIKNIKCYMIVHDMIPIVLKDFYEGFKVKRMHGMEKVLNSLSDKNTYFTVSESTKTDLLKYNPTLNNRDIIVAYPSFNHEIYDKNSETSFEYIKERYGIPKDKKYVLTLSSVEPRKNIIFAIKNYLSFIKQNNIDDLVFVAGGGIWKEYAPVFEKYIKSIPNNKVFYINYVDDKDLPSIYSNAFMFVTPTLYEGFGVPPLEAMQCGCPVITSNVSSLPEVVGDAAIQINPTSDEEMIKAYEKMYYDTDFRNECIKRGLERAKMFSWEKCADIMYKRFCEDMKNENAV